MKKKKKKTRQLKDPLQEPIKKRLKKHVNAVPKIAGKLVTVKNKTKPQSEIVYPKDTPGLSPRVYEVFHKDLNFTSQYVEDRRLGRYYEADPRSAGYPIRALLPRRSYEIPKSRIWACNTYLDQKNEGSCVGHAFAHELLAVPYAIKGITHADAVRIYKQAQNQDEWPGSSYSGTSVLAGAKSTMQLFPGSMESFRWATTITDVIATLGYFGPIILGINFYTGFYTPDANGEIHVSGDVAGGHALLMRGVDIKKSRFLLHNSWGTAWGVNGTCWISFQDFERLLLEHTECCVPVHRNWWKKAI